MEPISSSVFDSFRFISSHKFFLSNKVLLKHLAIASVVKSSGVGPSPPVVIRRLLLLEISFTNSQILFEREADKHRKFRC